MKNKRIQAFALALVMSLMTVQPQPFNRVENVQAASAKVVALNTTKVAIKVGMKTKLKLSNADAKKVKWKSSDKKIATVKKGVVTGKKPGRVKITAKYNGKKYVATIKVKYIPKKLRTTIKTACQGADILDYADDGKNIIFSPLSLNMALSMTLNGTTKEAGKEIEKYLDDSKEELNKSAKKLMKISRDRDSLNISNGVWYKSGYNLKDSFNDNVRKSYKADFYESKFDQSTVNEINSWVEQKTDGMIKRIVEKLSDDTCAVLINALLFEAGWDNEFSKYATKKKDFTDFSGNKKKVDMMSGEECTYYENDKATGFKKSYEHGEYSFIAILPKKKGKFSVDSLDLGSFLNSKTTEYDVDIEMPKFSYDWDSKDLIPNYLKSIGVNTIFIPEKNPLGNMFNSLDSFYVSDILQKCKIEVDEKGTKAAAVTAVFADTTSILVEPEPKRKEVILNRPFAYLIVDNTTGQTLFMGKVTSIDK